VCAIIAEGSQAAVAKIGKVSPRTMTTAKALKRDAVPTVVDAVKRGDVPIAQAAAFAKQEAPLDQQWLIVEHGSPADAVKATVKAKADRAEGKTQKPKPNMTPATDRAEQTAAAKQAGTATEWLSDVVQHLGRINVSAVVQRMTDDERTELLMQLVKANAWINQTAVDIAVSGGSKLGKLAPVSLRFEALEFLRESVTRIEAELAGRAVRESAE
jgi:hypothetical protein